MLMCVLVPLDSAAIPPPSSLSIAAQETKPEDEGSKSRSLYSTRNMYVSCLMLMSLLVVRSALEELSRTKAQKANPFAKPKM